MTRNKSLLPLIFILSALTMGTATASCYTYKEKSLAIKWTAFKTPQKIGVTGQLPSYTLKGKRQAPTLRELLKGQEITINLAKVDSGNKERDSKIIKFFFNELKGGEKLKGIVKDISDKKISFEITLNGKTQRVPLKYTFKDMVLKAEGHLDILDFTMAKQLGALNKACYALHEGKTWSDVTVNLETTLKSCKP